MEELKKVIQNEAQYVSEKNREEWIKSSLRYAKLCLERGDTIEKISDFIKS